MKLKIFLLIFLFSFCIVSSACADELRIDDTFTYPVQNEYGDTITSINGFDKGYCTHSYERLYEGELFICNDVRVAWYRSTTDVNSYELEFKNAWLKFSCWQAMYGVAYQNSIGIGMPPGVLLEQEYSFSFDPPPISYIQHPCRRRLITTPNSCQIDSKSIITSAFSQKFPLDLFIGIQGFSSDSTCPQFTIRNQTFQLCYVLKLVKSLKYVLLLVFILTSIIAL